VKPVTLDFGFSFSARKDKGIPLKQAGTFSKPPSGDWGNSGAYARLVLVGRIYTKIELFYPIKFLLDLKKG